MEGGDQLERHFQVGPRFLFVKYMGCVPLFVYYTTVFSDECITSFD